MSAYGLGLGLGMTSIAAAVARGSAVDVVPAGGDAASMAAPALAYATTRRPDRDRSRRAPARDRQSRPPGQPASCTTSRAAHR